MSRIEQLIILLQSSSQLFLINIEQPSYILYLEHLICVIYKENKIKIFDPIDNYSISIKNSCGDDCSNVINCSIRDIAIDVQKNIYITDNHSKIHIFKPIY